MRRRALLIALWLLLLIPVGLTLALPWLAAPGLRHGLRAAGLEGAGFEELHIGLRGAEIAGLRLGDGSDLELERLSLDYAPTDLLRGRLEAARLEGLVLRGRLDETGLHLGALDRFGGGDDKGATGRSLAVFPLPGRVDVSSGRIELATPWGPLVLPFSAEARLLSGDRIAVTLAVAGGSLVVAPADGAASGALAADLELSGEVVHNALSATEAVAAEGVLRLAVDDLDLPGLAEGVAGGGLIDLALADGRLSLGIRGFELAARALGPDLAALAGLLVPSPLTVTLGGPTAPLEVSLGLLRGGAGPPAELVVAGPVALTGAGSRLEAAIDAALALDDPDHAPAFRLAPSTLVLTAAGLSWDQLDVRRAELAIKAEGRPDELRATLDLDLSAEGEPGPGLRVEDARLRLPVSAAFDNGRLTLRPRAGGRLGAAGLRWSDSARIAAIEFALAEDAGPLLEATFEEGELEDWRHRLTLQPTAFALTIDTQDGGEPLELHGTTPRLDLELEAPGTGRALITDATVEVPAYDVILVGVGAELRLAPDGLAAGTAVPVRIRSLRHTGEPPWFRPVSLRGVLRPDGERGLAFQAETTGADGAFDLDAEGHYDPTTGVARAELRLGPLEFAPEGPQPGDLVPPLAGTVSNVSGGIALAGTIAWGPGEPASDLVLLVQDLGFTAGPARVERLNGAIRFDSLVPPSTPPDQLLAVALVDVGLPLVNGVIELRLAEDGTLVVDEARWSWAGGEVSTGAFAYRPEEPLTLTLQARGLDIGELLEQVRVGDLEGTGTLSGAVPLRIEGGEVVVDEGELQARGPGWLRYRPQEAPAALQAGGQSVDLMLQALENFRYETLRITLDGRTDGEMDVGLHISGANPELYGGYPVEFNLDLEGNLGALLRAGIQGYRLPGRIAERMERLRR